MIAACRVDTSKTDMDRLLLYVINLLDQIVNVPYTVVYSHYGASAANQPDFAFLRHVQQVIVSYCYR